MKSEDEIRERIAKLNTRHHNSSVIVALSEARINELRWVLKS